MFPSLYETGEQRTAFPKKGPMLPDMLVFPTITAKYRPRKLPLHVFTFVEEGDVGEPDAVFSYAGKQTPSSPIPTRAPRATANRMRRAFGRDIIIQIILYTKSSGSRKRHGEHRTLFTASEL